LCVDLFQVIRITDLSAYYDSGDPVTRLPSDSSIIGGINEGGCDFYIPDPQSLEGRVKKTKALKRK